MFVVCHVTLRMPSVTTRRNTEMRLKTLKDACEHRTREQYYRAVAISLDNILLPFASTATSEPPGWSGPAESLSVRPAALPGDGARSCACSRLHSPNRHQNADIEAAHAGPLVA